MCSRRLLSRRVRNLEKENVLFIPVVMFCWTLHASSCTIVAKPGDYAANLEECKAEAIVVAENMLKNKNISYALPYCIHAKMQASI